jgi:crotonobetainyl-CoA:carnitine CoA-transferase CaiB-like acyl-CoA transferase
MMPARPDPNDAWTHQLCDGLVVLELASVLAGPSVGQFFAELGARVIKVENPATRGDVTRTWKVAGEPDSDRSAYFHACNWGKESLALDLKDPRGTEVLHRLAAASDVVISNHLPRAARSLKADYDTLRAVRPDLIMGSIVGYDPGSDRPGYDAIIQAEAGYYHINGDPSSEGGHPTKMPVALMDILAGHQLKQALLMSLLRRERTGEGSHVTVSLFDAAVSSLTNLATNWLITGRIPEPMGSEHPNIAPYGSVFRTADGHAIVLGVGTDRQFRLLCGILGVPALAEDARFARNPQRVEHRDILNERLQVAILRHTRQALLEQCETAGIPAGAVRKMDEVFRATPDWLQLPASGAAARGVRETAIWPPAAPESMDSLLPPPHFGAHSSVVLRDVLGLTQSAVDSLLGAGVVVQT